MAKPEELLAKRLSNHILTKYPKIPFRFDLIDKLGNRNIGRQVKELHGIKFSRGYPDLFVATCRGVFGGLYLELKAEDKVPNTEHTRRQAGYHAVLRFNGYKCDFCCGLEDCKKKLKKYLKLKKNKV